LWRCFLQYILSLVRCVSRAFRNSFLKRRRIFRATSGLTYANELYTLELEIKSFNDDGGTNPASRYAICNTGKSFAFTTLITQIIVY
jgi:hypothetical protein